MVKSIDFDVKNAQKSVHAGSCFCAHYVVSCAIDDA